MKKVAVVGLGYVGFPLANALCRAGMSVHGVDTNIELVQTIESNKDSNLNLRVSVDYSQIGESEIVVICVPTPLDEYHKMDLAYLRAAITETAKYCKNNATIVIESTSFVGSLRSFVWPILKMSGKDLRCGVAPERIDPGNNVWNIKNTPRLVSGMDEGTTQLICDFYEEICDNVIKVSSPEVAEAAKLFENTFRLVNIALSMEIASLLQEEGIDFMEVLEAANTKTFGFMPFYPSLGVGGHCIPVDPIYLNSSFTKNKGGSSLIARALDINRLRVPQLKSRLETLGLVSHGTLIQILGLGYKANSSDVRESSAVHLMILLRKDGYRVEWHDPALNLFDEEESFPLDRDAATWIIGAWNDNFESIDFEKFPGKIITFSDLPLKIGATLIL